MDVLLELQNENGWRDFLYSNQVVGFYLWQSYQISKTLLPD